MVIKSLKMKKFILMCLMAFVTLSSFGQVVTKDYTILENTYVGVYGTALVPMDLNSATPVNSGFGIKAGKWITPKFGVNVDGSTYFGKNHYTDSHTAFKAVNVGVNANYKAFTVNSVSIVPEVGIGWLHKFDKSHDNVYTKGGIIVNVNLGNGFNVFAEPVVRWNVTPNHFEFNKHHAQMGLEAGVVYRFKNKDGLRNFIKYDLDFYNTEIAELRAELAKKPKEVVKEINVCDTIQFHDAIVFFAKNSDTILDFSELDQIPAGATVQVEGFASPEGTREYNMALSQRRADNVAEYLRSRNVNVSSSRGFGVIGDNSNRIVIVY